MTPEFALTIAAAGIAYVGIGSTIGRALKRVGSFIDQHTAITDELEAERAGYVRLRQHDEQPRRQDTKRARCRGVDGVKVHNGGNK